MLWFVVSPLCGSAGTAGCNSVAASASRLAAGTKTESSPSAALSPKLSADRPALRIQLAPDTRFSKWHLTKN